jgi:hypothetical protein
VQSNFQINPGDSQTFPWLSGIAARFQEYKIKGMVFHYIPTSGNAVASTNAALGSVMISTSYRANDAPPMSKVEQLNEYCSVECVPSETVCHPIECDPKENPFNIQYVRTTSVPAEDSRLLYDLGVTTVATSGQQVTGTVLGDLWVTYEIELKKPIVASNVTSPVETLSVTYTGTFSPTVWYPTEFSRFGTLEATATGKTVTFPRGITGTFLLATYFVSGGTLAAFNNVGGGTVVTNCTLTAVAPSTGSVIGSAWTVATGAGWAYCIVGVSITNPQLVATVAMPTLTYTGTIDSTSLMITPYGV